MQFFRLCFLLIVKENIKLGCLVNFRLCALIDDKLCDQGCRMKFQSSKKPAQKENHLDSEKAYKTL